MSRHLHRHRDARPILIRTSRPGDREALERLATLDSRTLPQGSFVLAEVGGELVAAAPLDVDGDPFGDPFRPTAELCELLRLHVRQLRRRYPGIRRRIGSLPSSLPEAA